MNNSNLTRIAVSIFFFVNGFLHANLTARLPLLQQNLAITDGILGTLLFTIAIGAMIGMPIMGGLAERFGSDTMARMMALLFCCIMPIIPFFGNIYTVGAAFLLLGFSMGAMDVCMNGQAVFVERAMQKPIMSSFHAVFSVGMASGAGIGALMSKYDLDLKVHIPMMAAISIILILWSSQFLIKEKSERSTENEIKNQERKTFSLPHKAIVPLGLIAFCCMSGEGAMADWSAKYMTDVIGKDKALGAITFGIYAAGMTLGRVFGDYFTTQFGKRKLMIYDALFTIFGLGLALSYLSVWTTWVGFFMVGLGVSTIVPIVFSSAGNTKGVHPSAGIAMASSIGYTGFFIGPPTIGFISDALGLRFGLGFSLFLFCVMYFLVLRFIAKEV